MAHLAVVKRAGVPVRERPEPEQGRLFETGICLETLRREAADLSVRKLAASTREAYEYAWERWLKWCRDAGRCPLPASAESLELWAVHMLHAEGLKLGTVTLWLAGVRHRHRIDGAAIDTSRAANLLHLARRCGQGLPAPKRAISLELLEAASRELLKGHSDRDARDRAILLLGFCGAFRRSELSALELGDVVERPEGLLVTLRRSKTDQEHRGRVVGIRPARRVILCPVRALRVWLLRRGDEPGPLFPRTSWGRGPIGGQSIAELLKRALRRAGVPEPELAGISAHSLRAGFVTTAAAAGASVPAIMAATGHRSVSMVERYVRPASAFAFDPLRGVL